MVKKESLLEGSIINAILKLSIPVFFSNILHIAYQLIDTFWVGRLGSESIVAVSISFPLISLLISLGSGFAMAGTILVAQYKGKKDRASIDHITAQTFLVGIALSIFIGLLGYILSPILISFIGIKQSIIPDAILYIQITFLGTVFVFIFMIFQALMRGVGNVKTPMFIILGTVILNMILDPLFILGYKLIPSFGVSGAAISTILTEGIAAGIGLFIILKGKSGLSLKIKEMKPDLRIIKKVITLGIPSSLDQSARALGAVVIVYLVATFGTIITAAFGVGVRIWYLVALPGMGIYLASSTLVGQNIGAGNLERAKNVGKISSFTAFIALSITGGLTFIFARPLASLFMPGEVETVDQAVHFIRIMTMAAPLMGIQMGLNGAFNGAGHTKLLMILSLVSIWILRLPIATILSKTTNLNETGIWLSYPLSGVIAAVISIVLFIKTDWVKKKII